MSIVSNALLSEQEVIIRESARRVATEVVGSTAAERDRTGAWPHDEIKAVADVGFMGMLALGIAYILVPMFALAPNPDERQALASCAFAVAAPSEWGTMLFAAVMGFVWLGTVPLAALPVT